MNGDPGGTRDRSLVRQTGSEADGGPEKKSRCQEPGYSVLRGEQQVSVSRASADGGRVAYKSLLLCEIWLEEDGVVMLVRQW